MVCHEGDIQLIGARLSTGNPILLEENGDAIYYELVGEEKVPISQKYYDENHELTAIYQFEEERFLTAEELEHWSEDDALGIESFRYFAETPPQVWGMISSKYTGFDDGAAIDNTHDYLRTLWQRRIYHMLIEPYHPVLPENAPEWIDPYISKIYEYFFVNNDMSIALIQSETAVEVYDWNYFFFHSFGLAFPEGLNPVAVIEDDSWSQRGSFFFSNGTLHDLPITTYSYYSNPTPDLEPIHGIYTDEGGNFFFNEQRRSMTMHVDWLEDRWYQLTEDGVKEIFFNSNTDSMPIEATVGNETNIFWNWDSANAWLEAKRTESLASYIEGELTLAEIIYYKVPARSSWEELEAGLIEFMIQTS